MSGGNSVNDFIHNYYVRYNADFLETNFPDIKREIALLKKLSKMERENWTKDLKME